VTVDMPGNAMLLQQIMGNCPVVWFETPYASALRFSVDYLLIEQCVATTLYVVFNETLDFKLVLVHI